MNGLSWLIYIANVGSTLGGFFTFVCIVTGIATIGFIIAVLVFSGDTDNYYRPLNSDALARNKENRSACKSWAIRAGLFCMLMGTLSSIIPNRETVLLIAASEIGDRVMNSEKMAKVGDRVGSVVDPGIDLLKIWIEQQTQTIKKSMEPVSQPATKN